MFCKSNLILQHFFKLYKSIGTSFRTLRIFRMCSPLCLCKSQRNFVKFHDSSGNRFCEPSLNFAHLFENVSQVQRFWWEWCYKCMFAKISMKMCRNFAAAILWENLKKKTHVFLFQMVRGNGVNEMSTNIHFRSDLVGAEPWTQFMITTRCFLLGVSSITSAASGAVCSLQK